eukprot:7782684-Lingulodinium_polyedra.AAC.1
MMLPRLLEGGPCCLLALLRSGDPAEPKDWVGAVARDLAWLELRNGVGPFQGPEESLERANAASALRPKGWRAR